MNNTNKRRVVKILRFKYKGDTVCRNRKNVFYAGTKKT